MEIDRDIVQEFKFSYSRSSGPGGQHVNTTNSKAEVVFNVSESRMLSEEQKEMLIHKLHGRLNKNDELRVTCMDGRSQHDNKELATIKMLELIEKGLKIIAKRKKTKPGKQAREKRLKIKRMLSDKKSLRKSPEL